MTTSDNQLVKCAVCGRHGWHTTDRCPDAATELKYLRDALAALRKAKSSAACAADELDGTRRTRAHELVDLIRLAITHTDRLAMVIEGDLRSR